MNTNEKKMQQELLNSKLGISGQVMQGMVLQCTFTIKAYYQKQCLKFIEGVANSIMKILSIWLSLRKCQI